MIEDKHTCPHCGEPLHQQPYLMSLRADDHRTWTPLQRGVALYLLLFIVMIGAFAIITRHL